MQVSLGEERVAGHLPSNGASALAVSYHCIYPSPGQPVCPLGATRGGDSVTDANEVPDSTRGSLGATSRGTIQTTRGAILDTLRVGLRSCTSRCDARLATLSMARTQHLHYHFAAAIGLFLESIH